MKKLLFAPLLAIALLSGCGSPETTPATDAGTPAASADGSGDGAAPAAPVRPDPEKADPPPE